MAEDANNANNANEAQLSRYRPLDAVTLPVWLSSITEVRERVGGPPALWRVREVGDGNLNLVFIVEGPTGSVCVKQALPYVRAAGPVWPMSPQRAFFEHAYYRSVAPYVARWIPRIYHYEPELYCTVMERLSPHIILRHGLMAAHRYPHIGADLGEYVARACFFTSDFAWPFERKMAQMALFAGNHALVRISVDLIFTDPYRASARNRHTAPHLDALVAELRRDGALKAAAALYGQKFLSEVQALIHGDLHSGSVMVSDDDTRVIDPEFAFYGPIGFDLGAFLGNLLLSWFSQPGHASAADDRDSYRRWIEQQARVFWATFERCFLSLWAEHAQGDSLPPSLFTRAEDAASLAAARARFVEQLFVDMLGFAACKMIRRLVGFAHVVDFESIPEPRLRARCEAAALILARQLLTHPEQFRALDAVILALPRAEAASQAQRYVAV